MNVYPTYAEYFSAKARFTPHDWQASLAAADHPCNRLIRIPTGFGKTAGTVLAWLWHRGYAAPRARWPMEFVTFCHGLEQPTPDNKMRQKTTYIKTFIHAEFA